MEVLDRVVSPLNFNKPIVAYLNSERFSFWLLILVVISHGIFFAFFLTGDVSCRPKGEISYQEIAPYEEKLDLDHYIEIICATELKSQYFVYFIYEGAIVSLLVIGAIILKSILSEFRINFLLHHEVDKKDLGDEALFLKEEILFKEVPESLQKWRKSKIRNLFCRFLVWKTVFTTVFTGIAIATIVLKYSIPSSRSYVLPVEQDCKGPLFWSDKGDTTENLGKYLCHFDHEVEIFFFSLMIDVLTMIFCFVSVFQVLSLLIRSSTDCTSGDEENLCFCCPMRPPAASTFLGDLFLDPGANYSLSGKIPTQVQPTHEQQSVQVQSAPEKKTK